MENQDKLNFTVAGFQFNGENLFRNFGSFNQSALAALTLIFIGFLVYRCYTSERSIQKINRNKIGGNLSLFEQEQNNSWGKNEQTIEDNEITGNAAIRKRR